MAKPNRIILTPVDNVGNLNHALALWPSPTYSAVMATAQNILSEIEAFMGRHDMSARDFGVAAMNDPAFVLRLRNGADIKSRSIDKIRQFILDNDKKKRLAKRERQVSVAA